MRARRSRHDALLPPAIVGLVVIVVGAYFAFAKDIPFTEPYRFSAVFDNSSALQVNSPVRIAGVDVGKVAKVEPVGGDSTASEVTIKMQERGLPIHRDARLKIRPRIFLEGNFFVDLRPGTPASPDLPDGGTIGPAQTSAPVQIDQVLGTLKSDARKDLQDLLDGYGEALAGAPEPGEDADQDPDTRGQTAAESLNDSLQDAPAALRDSSIVADAFRGTERGDLPRLILGLQRTTSALADREGSLKDLITNFNTTTGALAAEQDDLRGTLRELPQVLRAANPALDSLNASFPATRAFAREILPGVRETPASIAATLPWIAQARPLVSSRELAAWSATSSPPSGPGQVHRRHDPVPAAGRPPEPVLHQEHPAHRRHGDPGRLAHHRRPGPGRVLPGAGRPVGRVAELRRQRQLHAVPGWWREHGVHGLGRRRPQAVRQRVPAAAGHASPARPGKKPPFTTSSPCFRQPRPNLNAARTGGGP